ncbi:MAG: AtpZ/AtpI family protein [Candidatus Peribacteraceae bacterium]|jgi:F0F1-type ATP synthase assembly protein I
MPDQPPETPRMKEERLRDALWLAVRLVWDMGWIIAIPAVLLGFFGAYVDRWLGTSPIFILLGLALALALSFLGVKRKLKEILEKRF